MHRGQHSKHCTLNHLKNPTESYTLNPSKSYQTVRHHAASTNSVTDCYGHWVALNRGYFLGCSVTRCYEASQHLKSLNTCWNYNNLPSFMHLNSRSMNDLRAARSLFSSSEDDWVWTWSLIEIIAFSCQVLWLHEDTTCTPWNYLYIYNLWHLFPTFKCRSVQCAQCKCFRLLQVASGCVRLRQVASGCSRLLQVETLCHPCPVACQAASCLRLSVSTSCARSWACRVAWRNGRPKSAKQANRTFWHSTHIYIDTCTVYIYIYTYRIHCITCYYISIYYNHLHKIDQDFSLHLGRSARLR